MQRAFMPIDSKKEKGEFSKISYPFSGERKESTEASGALIKRMGDWGGIEYRGSKEIG